MLYTEHTDLCAVGTDTLFSGPDANGGYTWDCLGINGGNPVSCTADEDRCSDSTVNVGDYENVSGVAEECDDSNQANADGCTSACYREYPECSFFNFMVTPTTGSAVLSVTGTYTPVSGFSGVSLDRGTGSPVSNPSSTEGFSYLSSGVYTVVMTFANSQSGALTVVCDDIVTVDASPIDGACGTATEVERYGENSLNEQSDNLCATGTVV